jgi:hypothetical protein
MYNIVGIWRFYPERSRRNIVQYYWNGWVILALIIYVIVGGLGALCMTDVVVRKSDKYVVAIVSWLIGAAMFNGITYAVSSSGETAPVVGTHIVSQELGLESGKSYSVQLGTRVQGSTGSGVFYGGFFSSSGRVSLQPGSSVSMGFASGDSSYILEVPMSKVHFVKSASVNDASVQLYLQNVAENGYGAMKSVDTRCETVIYSLVLWQLCKDTFEYRLPADVERRGLAPIVTEYLDSATITLSPELYDRLLGTP